MDFLNMTSTLIRPALGQPLRLGMLYDSHRDAMIPGVTVWDMDTIHTDMCVAEQKRSDFKIIASDSIEDRASAFDIPAPLKASVLCDLIDVSGAAKYLKAKKTSKKKARVTVMHTVTTKFEQLTMAHLNLENITDKKIFSQATGTHVVTGVLYGAQAFYVFEHGVSSNESKHELQGALQRELEVAIGKGPISTLLWHGCHFTEDVAVNKPDKCKLNTASCTFYGDYALKGNLPIHEQAVSAVNNLPVFSDTSDETVVPIKAWLCPVKCHLLRFPVVHSISSVLIEEVQVVMEELSDIDMQCEDLLDEPAAIHFPDITSKIQRFRNLCQQYRLSFQKTLSDTLLSSRRGVKGGPVLADILSGRKQSPFNNEKLIEYMDSLETEVSYVSFCLNWMKGSPAINIVSSQQEINRVLWDPRVELVVLFTLTSLREEKSHLLDLKNWLEHIEKSSDLTSTSPDLPEKTRKWFDDADITRKIRADINEFIEFASANVLREKIQFIVSAITDAGNPGASVYLYEKGILKTASFHPPWLDVPVISSVSHDSVQLTCAPCPAGSDRVLGYRVEYRSMKDENWTIKDGTDTNRAFIVTGLLPNSMYQFRQSAVLARWVTRPSDPTAIIKTLPCSSPGKVNNLNKQQTSIALNWEEPNTIGAGTQVTDYKIEFMEESETNKAWRQEMTGKKTEAFTVQGLKPNSSYRFRVSAVCENAGISCPSEESVFSTIAEARPAADFNTIPNPAAYGSYTAAGMLHSYPRGF